MDEWTALCCHCDVEFNTATAKSFEKHGRLFFCSSKCVHEWKKGFVKINAMLRTEAKWLDRRHLRSKRSGKKCIVW